MPRSKRLTLVRDAPESRLSADVRGFDYYLTNEEKSVETRRNYADTLRLFEKFLADNGRPTDTQEITRQDVERWMTHLRTEGRASSTRHLRYAALSAFFSWTVREEILDASPMRGTRAPRIVSEPLQVLTDTQVRDVLKVCAGTDFKARRDTALIRVFLDTGARRSEVANITLGDWNPRAKLFQVKRKGAWYDQIPYGEKTGYALDRYIQMRAKQKHAHLPNFWITSWGSLSPDGIATLIHEIGVRAGIPNLHPHAFRHLKAHDHLATGGTEGNLMQLMGWHDRSMLDRYARATQKERAHAAFHASRTIGDRL